MLTPLTESLDIDHARLAAQLEQAGRLGIPFTTGLLLGVGETMAERTQALELLAGVQRRWGHIQEVILQPWRPDGEAATPLGLNQRDEDKWSVKTETLARWARLWQADPDSRRRHLNATCSGADGRVWWST